MKLFKNLTIGLMLATSLAQTVYSSEIDDKQASVKRSKSMSAVHTARVRAANIILRNFHKDREVDEEKDRQTVQNFLRSVPNMPASDRQRLGESFFRELADKSQHQICFRERTALSVAILRRQIDRATSEMIMSSIPLEDYPDTGDIPLGSFKILGTPKSSFYK